jgi:hypothetical protein
MLSRKTTRILATTYVAIFQGFELEYSPGVYEILKDDLHDFLWDHNFEGWFAARLADHEYSPSLKRFIMYLDTGESLEDPTFSDEERVTLGRNLLLRLAQAAMHEWADDRTLIKTHRDSVADLQRHLELDGYIWRDGRLLFSESDVLDTPSEQGVLRDLIEALALGNREVMLHHLSLSESYFVEARWDDSISNSRKFLEAVLREVAAEHSDFVLCQPLDPKVYEWAGEVRKYLKTNGLMTEEERDTLAKVYGLLSDTGGHPYIARQDEARLMRNLALTFAQYALLKLERAKVECIEEIPF